MRNLVWFLIYLLGCSFSFGSKQILKTVMPSINADVVLCDIEGTTTSISFVKDVLFPYAKNHSMEFLRQNWNDDSTRQIVSDLVALPEYKELGTHDDISVDTIAEFVTYLIEKDLKLGPLKTLQGLIWNKAYADKTVKGHIYEDVPKAFERWTELGLKICIYSSGSVQAQKLLFSHSEYGDLMPFLSDYFDTTSGYKREAKSYSNIVEKLGISSEKVLFLTDIIAEGEAAKEAGLQVIILDRPGNASLTEEERAAFVIANDFNEIEIKKTS